MPHFPPADYSEKEENEMIMPYHRDANGRLPVYDAVAGRYRFLTVAETATQEAGEAAYDAKLAERTAAWIAAGRPIDALHPHNSNRISYGRSDPDTGNNWPQRTDGKSG